MAFSKVLPFQTDSTRNAFRSKTIPVISVGRSPEQLRLRQRLLSFDGWTVRSLIPEQAEVEARSHETRLWIFCNTVEIVQLVYLACSVRRYSPASRLILIEGPRQPGIELSLFDRSLKMSDTEDALVMAADELASIA